ncbi:MAG TPA: hypothetical protein VG815_01830 [Chloroflexota bacterium]|jgi:hypothetical protein|nr:hypothetical protein [Chloroflexota bacterium]
MTTQTASPSTTQSEAWAAYNAGYGSEAQDVYRALGSELYRRAVSERIQELFAHGDEQNLRLDQLMVQATSRTPERLT